jgi:hypothetical protein
VEDRQKLNNEEEKNYESTVSSADKKADRAKAQVYRFLRQVAKI